MFAVFLSDPVHFYKVAPLSCTSMLIHTALLQQGHADLVRSLGYHTNHNWAYIYS